MSESMFKVLNASIDILNKDAKQQRAADIAPLYCDLCQGLCKDPAYHKVVRESYEHATRHGYRRA